MQNVINLNTCHAPGD